VASDLARINHSRDDLRSLLAVCTHCGDCLEACPTYVVSGLETESPRGRISLLEFAQNNPGRDDATVSAHIDSCTGCLGCVTACPEDVRYDRILPLARALAAQRPNADRSATARTEAAARRLTLETVTHPWTLRRLAPLLRAAQRFPSRRVPEQVRSVTELFTTAPSKGSKIAHFTPARGQARGRVGLLLGCSQRVMHPDIHAATIAVLAAEGFEVIAPEQPDCCGAIHAHAADLGGARQRAQKTISAFQAVGGVDHILTSAAGCGAAMKQYGELLANPEARAFASLVRDVSEFLAAQTPRAARKPLALTVAWHDSCQSRNGQRLTHAPGRRLLTQIPQLTVAVTTAPGLCCGALGSYRIEQPQLAAELGARRTEQLLELDADVIVASSPDCGEQLARQLRLRGRELPVQHPIELLARSIL
jgi:glycolate oxidase iron-sulfur subunit